jgi:DNA-binding CsgD family transcriptional regulator
MVRGLVMAHRGEFSRAEECVADGRSIFGHGDAHVVSTIDALDAQLAVFHRRPAAALATLDHVGLVTYFSLFTLNLRATAATAAGDAVQVGKVITDLSQSHGPWAALITRRIIALRQHDPDLLAQIAAGLAELGMPYESRLVLLEAAELDPAHDDSAERAAEALSTFDRLGAAPAGDRARRLLRQLGRRPAPGPRTTGQLSTREMQVAELVAQGLTNAEVGERLFISQRTVTTHLEHIYRRLGISSRKELTLLVTDTSAKGIRKPTDTGPRPDWAD